MPSQGGSRLVVVLALLAITPLHGAVRTWVSTSGIDNALCNRAQPCRTFGAAILAVDPGGEIVPLDTGGYGPFTITKSVAVIVPAGIQAAIAPTTGTAITINAGASDRVTLRGLFLNDQGNATRGIEFSTGAVLHVRNCEVAGFDVNLLVSRTSGLETVRVFISDSTFRDGSTGITFGHSVVGSAIDAVMDRCNVTNNTTGLYFGSRTQVTAHHVVASANFSGFFVSAAAAEQTHVNLDHCVATGNGFGIVANALVRLTGCSVTHNGTGVNITAGGTVHSLLNNLIEANATDVAGTINSIMGK